MATCTGAKVVLTAIGGNSLVTLAKLVGWLMTGSPSMLAECIHSAADTLNQVLIFVGIKKSEKKADDFFPWGHGKARYVWNLISAMGIFFIGFGFTTYHGVHNLLSPSSRVAPENLMVISVSILLFSLAVEGYALIVAWNEIKRQMGNQSLKSFMKESDDPTTLGVLFEDGVAVLGVLIALTSILIAKYLNFPAADAIGSILIGILMGVMAIYLSFLNGRLLIGSSSSVSKKSHYRDFLDSYRSIDKVLSLSAVVVGSEQVIISVDLELHEEELLDKDLIVTAIKRIKKGEEPGPIVVKHAHRMVRAVGAELATIEKEMKNKYPEILSVALEVH